MYTRPWVARLVRETLACSKKLAHHIGAVTASMCRTPSDGQRHSLESTPAKSA
jgi:hypothetical protein